MDINNLTLTIRITQTDFLIKSYFMNPKSKQNLYFSRQQINLN